MGRSVAAGAGVASHVRYCADGASLGKRHRRISIVDAFSLSANHQQRKPNLRR